MATTSFRILQRRSSTSGVTPQLCTLCDGELFVQLADETIYFRNNENQLVCTLTDKNLGNLYNIFAPTGDYVTNSQTGAFASIGNYVTTSQTGDLSSVFAPTGNYVTATQTGNLSSVFAPTGNYVTATQTGNLSSVFAPTGNYAVIVDGHIPAQYLPSYVDDVQEFNTITGLCAHAGEKGHIYLVSGCNSFWRWGGSQYVEIYASPGTSDGLVEGSTNLYFTAARSAGYVTTGSAANFVTTCQTGVFALSANTGNFETTGYARNCYVTTGETGSFLVGKIGTNINLGDSSNKSRLNEKSFLGAGVCNNQSGICCSFLGAGQCNQQHGWFSETGACIMDLYYPPGVLSGLGFGEASFLGAGCCNRQCGDYASFLGAGQKNRQFFNRHSFLGGGSYIYQSGSIGSFLGAGYYNSQQITLDSFIGAGYNNSLRAQWYSAIAAGYHNAINGVNDTGFYGSFIGAGLYNKICGSTHSSILAGENNQISGGRNVFVLGSGITANDQSNILYVNNLCVVSGIISGNGAGLTGLTAAAALCSGVNTLYESFVVNPVVNANLINFDVIPNSTLYYTGNTSTNFYLNLRGNASCTFNSILPLNNSLSTTFIHVNSSTAYCLTGISIDGVTQTIKWAGGGGVAAGITSSTNIYSITTFKTGNNLYCNFVSLGFFS